MFGLGAPELLILLVLGLVPLVGAVDAARRPEAAFAAAGQSKLLWVLLQLLGLLFCVVVGLVFSAVYFATIRPKLSS